MSIIIKLFLVVDYNISGNLYFNLVDFTVEVDWFVVYLKVICRFCCENNVKFANKY